MECQFLSAVTSSDQPKVCNTQSKTHIRADGYTKINSKPVERSLSVLVLTSEATCNSIKFQIRERRLCTFIRNFGDHGEISLMIKGGKISARVEYSGRSQSFLGILNPDGKWNGRLTKQLRKEKITLFIRRGKISRKRISQVPKLLQGDSNILLERVSRKKSIRGDSQFKIKLTLSPKSEVAGLIEHKSGRHSTRIELSPGGRWNAKGWVKLTGGRFLFSAEIGKCQTCFEGTPRFVPKTSDFRKG